MLYATIDGNNIVKGVSELAGQVENASMIPIETFDSSLIGKHWTGTVFESVTPAKRKILTRYEFRQLFTFQEQVAITTAAKTDVVVEVFMKSMEVAEVINLDFPETAQGLAYLVSQSLITEGKMTTILEGI